MRITREFLRVPVVGYGWVRLLPIGAAVAYVALLHIPEVEPSWWDWLLALGSAGLVFAGGRRPLTVTLLQCALLVLAVTLAPLGQGLVRVLAAVALGELALRRPGWPTWCGAAALAAGAGWGYFPLYTAAANVLMVLLEVGLPVLLGSFLRSVRELAREAEQRAAEAERRRAWEVTAARAAERSAIAREVHDMVAHHVASIVLRVGVVRHVVPVADPRVREALHDVHAIGGQALADLRRLVSVLRDPDTVSGDVLLAANDLASALSNVIGRTVVAGVEVDVAIDAEVGDELDTVHRHAVLRIVGEGLTNVLKYAGPGSRARVAIHRDENARVLVEVSDEGSGAASRTDRTEPGHGLIVMRERVELLDGSFYAGPRGPGWVLRATLPGTPAETTKVTG